ncbi:MAG: IS66 family transposase [Acetobacteraceae bacterium]|nr:IS66 family transposase [Acetobacteraceae bacterium]
MKPGAEVIEVNFDELEGLLERARQGPLGEEDHAKLQAAVRALSHLIELIGEKDTTISRLRALLAKPSTEKTSKVLEEAGIQAPAKNGPPPKTDEKPKPGHGRNSAEAYRGAGRIQVAHAVLKPGDHCPRCLKGKVYEQKEPALRLRVVGQAPLQATVYELERLRCNLCGDVFEAEAPEGVGEKKYDETAAAMIGLLKYGSGLPFYRLEGLQGNLGIPLPASTQWEIVAESAELIRPAWEEMIRQAAQGEVLYNDDTAMKILALARASPHSLAVEKETSSLRERRGQFTSGIISTRQGQRIALFFTGRKHAGENLAQVLAHRAAGRAAPIQMCDALSRNLPGTLETIVGNCLAHARRHFVEVTPNFPQECRFVLEALGEVYGYDAQAEGQGLSPQERLRFHRENSAPVLEKLHAWLQVQFEERKAEPNSGLGTAMTYLLRHWERLTLFLRQAGAPLDSNLVERALKKCILHRKNSLFYKTATGAEVGDLFMSLIHTCELNGAYPFDYLTKLQKHTEELAKNPAAWMPWNYHPILSPATTNQNSA